MTELVRYVEWEHFAVGYPRHADAEAEFTVRAVPPAFEEGERSQGAGPVLP
ncbi:hypothetical protein [Streptomyces sp. NPDC005017]|uniref:hypothetical protein n=1 Tax=Streptomyces sp. NPDC005017 TaxID=3364706 RepID=UPI00368E138B